MRGVRAHHADRVAALSARRSRSRRSALRGAAMIEAVIVLPVLLLTWAGVSFVHARYLARQHALLDARGCAWAHAVAACAQPPPECSAALRSGAEPAHGSAAIMSAARAHTAGSGIDVFDDIPVLGDALGALFGAQTAATAEVLTPVPWDRTSGVVDRAELVLQCNERPHDVLQAAKDVFCERASLFDCGGGS